MHLTSECMSLPTPVIELDDSDSEEAQTKRIKIEEDAETDADEIAESEQPEEVAMTEGERMAEAERAADEPRTGRIGERGQRIADEMAGLHRKAADYMDY
jgi:hypothetical protein